MARLPVCLLWAGDSMVASVSLVTQWLSQTIPGRTSAVVLTPYLTLLRSPSALQLSDW